jgi:hypothetical protein
MKRITPENAVKKAILDLLAAESVFAFRLNTASFAGENAHGKKRFFQAHGLGRGAADILALPPVVIDRMFYRRNGITPLWIETKAPGGKQSPEQRRFEANVRAHRHEYLLVDNVDTLIRWLKEHGL